MLCLYLFKTLELARYDQNDFDPLIDVGPATVFLPTKQLNLTKFRSDQTSLTSSAALVKPSKHFGVKKC